MYRHKERGRGSVGPAPDRVAQPQARLSAACSSAPNPCVSSQPTGRRTARRAAVSTRSIVSARGVWLAMSRRSMSSA